MDDLSIGNNPASHIIYIDSLKAIAGNKYCALLQDNTVRHISDEDVSPTDFINFVPV